MAKTLTGVGIHKIGQRFADSIDHAAYTLNGIPKTVAPFRKIVEGETVSIAQLVKDAGTGRTTSSPSRPRAVLFSKGRPSSSLRDEALSQASRRR